MRRNGYHSIVALALIALLAEVSWAQEKPTPGFNTKIPESVLTPDTVETKLGTLEVLRRDPRREGRRRALCQLGP